ncbi:hypothetical protein [Flavobacterium hungaricum]|uniref:Uncharacterized protein n=1 Tax=Flavobacterium hungaricum TaxID=2082725 RepID=A0ABR9TIY8_9FLAO|nr:hypothetical protein [Flavobacterium hungaricum]MBE8724999.1 hypothetical protein [Flavobacterium hungaricum]
MKTENPATETTEKLTASLLRFASEICFQGEFRNHPEYLTEIFEYILETEMGNDLQLRTKMLSCIKTSRMLVKALEPFSDEEIQNSSNFVLSH